MKDTILPPLPDFKEMADNITDKEELEKILRDVYNSGVEAGFEDSITINYVDEYKDRDMILYDAESDLFDSEYLQELMENLDVDKDDIGE